MATKNHINLLTQTQEERESNMRPIYAVTLTVLIILVLVHANNAIPVLRSNYDVLFDAHEETKCEKRCRNMGPSKWSPGYMDCVNQCYDEE
jgi:PhoPQ-activated pathogenicity-related protein